MRIVGGDYKGRRIATPSGTDIRPTTDRIREALFNVLEHGIEGLALSESRIIDLFAGTGALGLEALSRGAKFALFIEESAASRGLIRENIEALGATGKSKIFRRDATKLGPVGTMEQFTVAFLDPPYGHGLGELALNALHEGGWLKEHAIIILEEDKSSRLLLPETYQEIDHRTYGNTQILIACYLG